MSLGLPVIASPYLRIVSSCARRTGFIAKSAEWQECIDCCVMIQHDAVRSGKPLRETYRPLLEAKAASSTRTSSPES